MSWLQKISIKLKPKTITINVLTKPNKKLLVISDFLMIMIDIFAFFPSKLFSLFLLINTSCWHLNNIVSFQSSVNAGNTNWRGRLSTVDLLIKVPCFVYK